MENTRISVFKNILDCEQSVIIFFAKLLHAKPKSVSVVAEIRTRRNLGEKADCKQSKNIRAHVDRQGPCSKVRECITK